MNSSDQVLLRACKENSQGDHTEFLFTLPEHHRIIAQFKMIEKWEDPKQGAYLFARTFEWSIACGETGLHEYLGSVIIKSPLRVGSQSCVPILCWGSINLETYIEYRRIRRPRARGGGQPYPIFEILDRET